jgi:NADPH:quinone reductase-like Zn-dependent oxidoreductase
VGTFAVQIAAILGAHVTAVCSGRNSELVRQLGAHDVIDYTRQDLEKLPTPFDVFFDVFGNHRFPDVRRLITPRGAFISTVPGVPILQWAFLSRLSGGPRAHLIVVKSRATDLQTISAWIEAGRLSPVVDRIFPLEAVQEAHTYIETKRARGKVVLRVP